MVTSHGNIKTEAPAGRYFRMYSRLLESVLELLPDLQQNHFQCGGGWSKNNTTESNKQLLIC